MITTQRNALKQMTLRSILTGVVVGSLLTPCNIYSGLKIGWSFNMSILAALLGFAFWNVFSKIFSLEKWSMQENVYNQTAASAAASIISGGLVAPIPAYTILTGQTLSAPVLIFWVFAVSFLGVLVAIGLRQQMLVEENLPFPSGVATAETIKDLHSKGKESFKKIACLFSVGGFSFAFKLINDLVASIPKFHFLSFLSKPYAQLSGLSLKKLGVLLDPSLMMLGFGMIMGTRAGISLLLGALISWVFLPPLIINNGWVTLPSELGEFLYGDLVTWTLWPGVGLMVVASLTSFSISLVQMVKNKSSVKPKSTGVSSKKVFYSASLITLIVLTIAQHQIFGISLFMGALAVVASLLLGIVSSRVSGETGIPPIGALGKVTQLSFGLMNPGNMTANLMTANVTGGAAGQSSDLLHDLKAGLLLNTPYRLQIVAQSFGILAGAFVGSLSYMILIPNPAKQLLTSEWPAPAVATWKSVAELMAQGTDHFPAGAVGAMIVASVFGLILALLEKFLPEKKAALVPSASAIGLAFIIPAWTSLTMFIGSMIAFSLAKWNNKFSKLYALVIAAGLVAGESMGGVFAIISKMLQ